MNRLVSLAPCLMSAATAGHDGGNEKARWQSEARNAHIVRDNWGIAHVYAKSDADAVFGSLYAQAEDDFARIERNYLIGLDRREIVPSLCVQGAENRIGVG